MARLLNASLLSRISSHIAAQMGLHFPEARWHELERGLVSAAHISGFPDVPSYAQWLLSAPLTQEQIGALARYLTVGETYFFRDKRVFDLLRGQILPELITKRRGAARHLRIWSAGCCTGEEAYSIAILLSQLMPDWDEWLLTILATDINPHFLHKAVEGHYGEWSFRDVPSYIKDRYFTCTQVGRFEIVSSIKQRVKFTVLNLASESYPALTNNTNAMDIIFCRNVLMYFSPEQAKKAVRNLYNSLAEGGWLIVGAGESSQSLFSDFTAIQFPDLLLYQKNSQKNFQKSQLPLSPPMPQTVPLPRKSSERPANTSETVNASETKQPLPSRSECKTLYEQGHYALAEAEARLFLSEYPHDVVVLSLMARIYANQGKLDEALVWCERAIAVNRLNAGSYYLLATIQEERGEVNEAMKALRRALYLEPDFVLAHFALGSLSRRQGKQSEADKHFANMLWLLSSYQQEDVLPESDGLTAGKLMEMMRSVSLAKTSPLRTRPMR
jgi:chemotaxis protein methyltransferase CheR